jgi:adenosylmethionine-8-amino-7-oxononanoate aminotransferase
MTAILHRSLRAQLPTAVGGEGIHLIDAAGRRYIDASGGAAVSCLGHGHPRVREAMHRQLDTLAYAHTSFFTTEIAETLAQRLIADAPPGISHVYLVSGGSEAIEAALKLARQYFVEIGQPQRRHFIARRQSYHGNTLGALAVGGNVFRRAPFAPLLIESTHVGPCYEYRDRAPQETPAQYSARLVQEFEEAIERLGPGNVIAFVAETVVGATAGAVPPTPGYFRGIRELCDRHGILLILDEVMCGMGRTGTLHACEQEGIVPDLMTIAKGLGGGYGVIGATLVAGRIIEAISLGSGAFQHGHTYIGHALACAAALAVQDTIRDENLLADVRARGEDLAQALIARFADHPHVGDIRGRGLFRALELVSDRATKAPFDPVLRLHARVKAQGMARGLMTYPGGGTIDGAKGDHVLLAPPYIVTANDIDEIVRRLGDAIDAAIAEVAGDIHKAHRPLGEHPVANSTIPIVGTLAS